MATSDALKIARLRARADRRAADVEMVKAFLGNPILELVGGFVLVEVLQRTPASRPIIGNVQGNLLQTAIIGGVSLQQLAPILPTLAQAGTDIMGAAGKLAPALAML